MTETRVVNVRDDIYYDVYIGRPSIWGNPFRIGRDGTRAGVLHLYRKWIQTEPQLLARLSELEGKTLGCHCKPLMCHGDILVELLRERKEQT